MKTILITIVLAFVLSFLLGFLLGLFKKIFFVKVDPKIQAVRDVLPGANCGGCGFPGCDGFAAVVACGKAPANGCAAGGPSTAKKVGDVLGVAVSSVAKVTVLACQGNKDCALPRGKYNGIHNCASAALAVNGTKMCAFGCIGFGDCVSACSFGALAMGKDGLPKVDYSKCTGCGICVKTCPRKLFTLMPADTNGAVALCSNRSEDRVHIRKNCTVGCIKCGKCTRDCKQGALSLVNGLPVIDYTKCNNCGECVASCPEHVFKLFSDVVK
ncbi:MAG: RnfABCDGE type electron transport complex subunit B [Treponema sp.]